MGRTSTKAVADDIIVENDEINAVENMNEEEKKSTKKAIKTEPLKDTDEIEVESLVANVSYKDSRTGDMYEWDVAGHTELMTFDTLKNMWRSHKGYFRNMWLKPNDPRVINQFGFAKTFAKYEYLMDASNYTKKNIKSICEAIAETPNGLKFAICDKVKSMVIDGEVSDVTVIRELEKRLHIDLIDFL